jgi:hypothetical protein
LTSSKVEKRSVAQNTQQPGGQPLLGLHSVIVLPLGVLRRRVRWWIGCGG